MPHIVKKHISTGVTWIAIEKVGLYLCCGCPADTVKHLRKHAVITTTKQDGINIENGPNAILLSDTLIQNGQVANLTEFVILQMIYLQGVNLPEHPNYKKWKPLMIGYKNQIQRQLDYVTVGNHGLSSVEEIMECDVSQENAKRIFATKTYYSGGELNNMSDIIDTLVLGNETLEIKKGVMLKRQGVNKFIISYKDESVTIDLNIKPGEHFPAPYTLPFRSILPGKFSVTHTGEGNGWDKDRPCMASIIYHDNRIYLIDAGPNILYNLSYLGIGLSEIDGIFLSHIHDDHFAGITELLNVERRLNLYTTKLVRHTAVKKLGALMNSRISLIEIAFDCVDLKFDQWNNINGLEVKPVYSPHTVETNTFSFRVASEGSYKTYTHLSDTINLSEFDLIVKKFPKIFSAKEVAYVEKNYLSKVNLKKIDVGGGHIHGHLSDYQNDQSDLLVIAHTSNKVASSKENFVNVDFGTTHVLLEDQQQSMLRHKTKTYLRNYFDSLDDHEIELLAENKVVTFDPGESIIGKASTSKLYLIISGIVFFANDQQQEQRLDAGNFIGYSKRYFRHKLPDQYKSWSYVQCVEYEESYLNRFLLKYNLVDDVNSRINMIGALRNTEIISNLLSNAVINWISKNAEFVSSKDYQFDDDALNDHLFLISKGKAFIGFKNGQRMAIEKGQHFGGLKLMQGYRRDQQFYFEDDFEVISISVEKLMKIPKVLWRLLELEERRYQRSIFTL